jgi:hypothetical protein
VCRFAFAACLKLLLSALLRAVNDCCIAQEVVGTAIRPQHSQTQRRAARYDAPVNEKPAPPSNEQQRFDAILGATHTVLAEVASQAARKAADAHISAGRLVTSNVQPSYITAPPLADTKPTPTAAEVEIDKGATDGNNIDHPHRLS